MFCKRYPLVVHYISFSIKFTKARLSHCRCDFDLMEDLRERPEAKDHFLGSSLRFWSKFSPSSEISTQNVLICSNILLPSFPYLQVRSTKIFCRNTSFFAQIISWFISLPLMFDARLIRLSQHILLPSCHIFTIYFIFCLYYSTAAFFLHSPSYIYYFFNFFCLFLICCWILPPQPILLPSCHWHQHRRLPCC